MKKILLYAAAALILFSASVPLINNLHAHSAERYLLSLPVPAGAEIIESLSAAQKLTGNGNGMQYFAAILLRSPAEPEEIEAHYAAFRRSPWECLTEQQHGTAVACTDRGNLSFRFTPQEGERYYIIYTWADSLPLLAEIDLRGH